MSLVEINKRYTELATSECCLSCGGAINYSEPLKGEVCVDLGSGRGTDVLRMAELVGETGFVYGIDISDGMIAKAQQTALNIGVSNVRFIQCPLEKLDLTDETVDLTVSNCTINHAENKQEVWNEIYRITKFGGRFVVSDIYALAPIAEEYKNDPEAIAECWAGAVTRDEYLKSLYNAGFVDIKILEETAPYEKGKALVASWTITGRKLADNFNCCCG